MKLGTQEIYNKIKHLEGDKGIEDIPEIRELIMKFEDAISCILNTPEKLNPTLAYNLQLIISSLIDVLKDKNNALRKSQIASIISIIDFLISGNTRGLIKLPTGAGKTRLFTEIVTSLGLPTVIMVPKINLKGQTSDYFSGQNVFNIGENGTVLEDVTKTLQTIREKNITNPIIIITYQSFVRLREDKKLFQDFSQMIKVVIRDEAHRSLGDKTQETLDDMHTYDEVDEETLRVQDRDLLETDVFSSNEKLELLFTATPNLLDKSVRDAYEEIFGLRIQDLVEEGVLHMPKFIQVSEAFIDIGDQNLGERILNQFATKFVNEKKEFTYVEIANKYLELKQENNDYLPAVGFCRDIEHAEFMKKYLEERGLRSIRVTSSNARYDAGVPEDEAKRMIEANEVDIVLTVTKVSEGWDVPTLRCALNFAPILSEAKYIQGVGRVLRVLRVFDFEKEGETNEANGTLSKSFAYVIEPKFWNISSSGRNTGEGGGSEGGNENGDEKSSKSTTKISGITHFIDSGEFDIGYLRNLYGDLDEYGQIITQEEVLEFFKTKSFEEWMKFTQKDISKIEFKGKKIMSLATLAGWSDSSKADLYTPAGFQSFIAWIFERESDIVTKEKILEFFRAKTFEEWVSLRSRDILKIELKGKKIISLVRLSGCGNPHNVTPKNPSGFQEFIAWVFERDVEILTPEQVRGFFKERTFDEWMSLPAKGIQTLEYRGKKITSLVTLSGWDNPYDLDPATSTGFQQFIAWIFGKESTKQQETLTPEQVRGFFKERTFDEWMKLTQKDIKKLEYRGKKIISLVKFSGWNNSDDVIPTTSSGFQEFIAWVFERDVEILTPEQVRGFFKERTFDEWMSLPAKGIQTLEYRGKKITSLVTLSGWDNPDDIAPIIPSGFQQFIAWIFGKEFIKQQETLTPEQIRGFFKERTFDEWMKLTQKDIKKLEYRGKKIMSLVKFSGWGNPHNVAPKNPSGFQEFISWIFGKENPSKKV